MITPDCRDSAEALVHKDLRLAFDGNRHCVPPRYVGRHLTIKADASAVTIYDPYQAFFDTNVLIYVNAGEKVIRFSRFRPEPEIHREPRSTGTR